MHLISFLFLLFLALKIKLELLIEKNALNYE